MSTKDDSFIEKVRALPSPPWMRTVVIQHEPWCPWLKELACACACGAEPVAYTAEVYRRLMRDSPDQVVDIRTELLRTESKTHVKFALCHTFSNGLEIRTTVEVPRKFAAKTQTIIEEIATDNESSDEPSDA